MRRSCRIGKEGYKTHPCQEIFKCRKCGREVIPDGAGSDHRNHCPNCLTSMHVDDQPGDRSSDCSGQMEPIAVWVKRNGEWGVRTDSWTAGDGRSLEPIILQSPVSVYTLGGSTRLKIL